MEEITLLKCLLNNNLNYSIMIVAEKTSVRRKQTTFGKNINSKKIYINTLVPYFEFKNKLGKSINLKNFCINL